MMGSVGEEVVSDDNLVWITKTHYPVPTGKKKFNASKMIVITRNPIDVFPSFCSLFNCCSHSLVPKESYQDLEFWKEWVSFATKGLKKNHEQDIRVS